MNISGIHAKGFLLFAALFCLLLTNVSEAQDSNVAVPFLFSEDEKLEQTALTKVITRSRALQSDQYLNSPMTRMEYMLSRMEVKLDTGQEVIRQYLAEGFEPSSAKSVLPESIEGYARYSRQTGRITVGYRIRHSGHPTKPIRVSCKEVLGHLAVSIPQRNIGSVMHYTTLGVLAQEDGVKYIPIMEKLAKNIVHRVLLVVEDSGVTYGLACQRTGEGAPIQYHRHSF